ncbi:helix-turn-helix domain-containing protein [Amycolatopsis sp. WAC 01376]|uniref:helix-turn-helix domain-containing protein n=1 Tax=Amycolatopsis sp. WAC 01376 TaxID=2203195 RepID=UPI001F1BA7B9|nr:helix-turn-helix transcriptional regulator [Amycolatopsis sp. WAC 01376]
MEQEIEQGINRAILLMQQRLSEKITIGDMADAAMYSKFHFSRMFHRITGISPGRFLSALRLEHAKQLLMSTDLTTMEISHRVGYASVGTFGNRFTSCVGLPPSVYRQYGGLPCRTGLRFGRHGPAPRKQTAVVCGRLLSPRTDTIGPAFVGLFPDPLPEGSPAGCAILSRPGPFILEQVPAGTWYLLARCATMETSADSMAGVPSIGVHGPFTVHPGSVQRIDVHLRPRRIADPPALLAILDRVPATSQHDAG